MFANAKLRNKPIAQAAFLIFVCFVVPPAPARGSRVAVPRITKQTHGAVVLGAVGGCPACRLSENYETKPNLHKLGNLGRPVSGPLAPSPRHANLRNDGVSL